MDIQEPYIAHQQVFGMTMTSQVTNVYTDELQMSAVCYLQIEHIGFFSCILPAQWLSPVPL